MGQWNSLIKDKRGAMAPITIILMVIFFALLAFVIDLGHLFLVREQLQNAADAAALAGARALFPYTTGNTPLTPDWSAGSITATATLQSNKADTQALLTGTVQTGYWDLTWTPATAPATLLASSSNNNQTPAVRVFVTKQGSTNNGPVALTFGLLFGINTVNVNAKATAIIGFPAQVNPANAFPLAINSLMFPVKLGAGNPYNIGSNYHYPTAQAGQWTSFSVDENNVPYIRDLMAGSGGNGAPLTTQSGDIWIEPGTKDTLFADANAYAGQTVLLPVVNDAANGGGMTTHADDPIIGFTPFTITAGVGGSGKYVQGYFVTGLISPGSLPGGPNLGALTPPELVQ